MAENISYHAPRGVSQGIAVERIDPDTVTRLKNINNLGVLKRGVLSEMRKNGAYGPYQLNLELFRNITTANLIVTLLHRTEHDMITSPLGFAVDTPAYSVKLISDICNMFTTIINKPAPTLKPGEEPNVTVAFTTERKYHTVIKGAPAVLSSVATKALREALAMINSSQPANFHSGVHDLTRLRESYKIRAEKICELINMAFSTQMGFLSDSLVMAILTALRHYVYTNSIPVATAYATNMYATAIGQQMLQYKDIKPWEREKTLWRSLYKCIAKKTITDTYGLGKDNNFLISFIGNAEIGTGSMTNEDGSVTYAQVISSEGHSLNIKRILSLHIDLTRPYKGCLSGLVKCRTLVGKRPLTVINPNRFETKEVSNTIIPRLRINDKEFKSERSANDIVKLVSGTTAEKLDVATKMTGSGYEMLDLNDTKQKRIFYERENDAHVIDYVNLNDIPIKYIEHEGEAILLDIVNSYPDENNISEPQIAVDGTFCKHEMMYVSVGDYHETPSIKSWEGELLTDTNDVERPIKIKESILSSVDEFFTQKDVTMYTPHVTSEIHKFGKREIAIAMNDIAFYNPVKQLKALRKQYESAKNETEFVEFREMIMKDYHRIKNYASNYIKYISSNEKETELIATEKKPFWFFHVNEENDQLEVSSRNCFGELPVYLVPMTEHIIRANKLLSCVSNIDIGKVTVAIENLLDDLNFVNDQRINLDDIYTKQHFIVIKDFFFKMGKNFVQSINGECNYHFKMNEYFIAAFITIPVLVNLQLAWDENQTLFYATSLKWYSRVRNKPCERFQNNDFAFYHNMSKVIDLKCSQLFKMIILYGMSQNIHPQTINDNIKLGMPFGFAINFFRKQTLRGYDMFYTQPSSVSMIVAPQPIEITETENKTITCLRSTAVQTANNMYGGTAIRASTVYPNPQVGQANGCTHLRPKISIDFLTLEGYNSLDDLELDHVNRIPEEPVHPPPDQPGSDGHQDGVLQGVELQHEVVIHYLDREDTKQKYLTLIKDQLTESEHDRQLYLNKNNGERYLHEAYVGIIRPKISNFSVNWKPYMGIPRAEATTISIYYISISNFFHLITKR